MRHRREDHPLGDSAFQYVAARNDRRNCRTDRRTDAQRLINQKETRMPTWAENNSGQRAEAERLEFDRLAIDVMRAQLKARKAAGAAAVDRAFHAKALLAVDQATVAFRSDLPRDLAIGFAKPGAS